MRCYLSWLDYTKFAIPLFFANESLTHIKKYTYLLAHWQTTLVSHILDELQSKAALFLLKACTQIVFVYTFLDLIFIHKSCYVGQLALSTTKDCSGMTGAILGFKQSW